MQEFKKEDLFTLEEAAKWCGLKPKAMYMRYFRGQIKAVPLPSHRLYFSRQEIDEFRAKYVPFSMNQV